MGRRIQKEIILDYIKDFGSITTFQAFEDLGITKLTTRISELRADGIPIAGERIPHITRYGKHSYYNKYTIEEGVKAV
ncbi:MAG: hypothetical protein IKR26_04430 [Lachnospiraceae bacterium]|nr:hypothetical protein [Lachnospiraceae bacterium]